MAKAPTLTIELTHQDLLAIGATGEANLYQLRPDPRRYQVGVAKTVSVPVDFSTLGQFPKKGSALSFAHGVVSTGSQGELVWTARIASKNATALRIGFEKFQIPSNAELYVYTDRGEAFGPYREYGPNDNGEFWTNTTAGSQAFLQLHYFGSASDLADMEFHITGISHMGPRLLMANYVAPELAPKAFCSWNASCVENASCGSSSAVNDATKAVAEMIYVSGGGSYICTGGLLADTDTGSVVPYFLTANHCVSKGREANSLETVFDFSVSCNSGNCPRYGDGFNVRTNGSSIVATNRTSDYTLLQLAQTPGGTRAYLGWTTAEVAFSNNTSLYRVSHPSGSPLAYSEHSVDTGTGTCSSWPRGNWIYTQDTFGATEGGSSGSPIVNGAGEVVGQLSGACGTNLNDVCDANNNATVDGAFAAYFSDVAPFLDPDNGGGDPPGQCDLLPSGASCTSNGQCCSGNCKGKPGSRTCK